MREYYLVYVKGATPREFNNIEQAVVFKQNSEMADQMVGVYNPSDYKLSIINNID